MHQTAQIFASGITQVNPLLIGLLCLSLGAAFGLILSCAALVAIALQCLEQGSRAGRVVRSAVLAVALTATGSAQLAAQDIDADRTPVLEPELSKLYGSETLDFAGMSVSGAISPDGRWLAYSHADPGQDASSLWVVSLDTASEPIRLTTGKHWDSGPAWFPDGDRIAFRSSRADPGGNSQYLMTIKVDRNSGRPVGPPRQVSLEPVPFTMTYAVSPDGQWIAYVPRRGMLGEVSVTLEVVPASGGTTRPLVEQMEGLFGPVWSTDGYIYFISWLAPGAEAAVEIGFSVKRVPEGGGRSETLATWPGTPWATICPGARYVYFESPSRDSEEDVYALATVDGQLLGGFSPPDDMKPIGCTAEEAHILATVQEEAAPLKVVPIGGGPASQLTETRAYDWPLGWTPDSRAVVFESQLDGRAVILMAPTQGGAMRQLPRPDEKWVYGPVLSRDNRHILYGVREDEAETSILKILDLSTGDSRELTRTPWEGYPRYNSSRWDEKFLYAEKKDGRFDFRAVRAGEDPVLLRSFPDSVFPPIIGVDGDRLAFWVASGGNSTLYLATAGQPDIREILTFPGSVGQRGRNEPVWSPDGRYLATGARPLSETTEQPAIVVEFTPKGEVVGQPRVVQGLPESWWDLEWLPNSESFLIADGDVWLVSLEPGADPVNLTDEEPLTWSFSLSPDGQYIAFSPEVRRGGAFWRLDLSEALVAGMEE